MTCTHRWEPDIRPYSPISGSDAWIAIHQPVQFELSYNNWGGVQSTNDANTEVLLASQAGPECLRSKGIFVPVVLRPRSSCGDGSIGGLPCPCINYLATEHRVWKIVPSAVCFLLACSHVELDFRHSRSSCSATSTESIHFLWRS